MLFRSLFELSTESIWRKTRKQTKENKQLGERINDLENDLRLLRVEREAMNDKIERLEQETKAGME